MGIGFGEWMVIILVALLLFGAGRLPELGRNLGEGIRGFKRGLVGEEDRKSDAAGSANAPRPQDPPSPGDARKS